MTQKVSIMEWDYVVTDELCRWWLLYHRGHEILKSMPGLGVDDSSYLFLAESAIKGYFLLAPFGKIYLMIPLNIQGNEVNVKVIFRPYGNLDNYGSYNSYIGILIYLALEIVRRGLYIHDPQLKKFKDYYDKIREKIPEQYTIYIDDEEVDFGLEDSLSLWNTVCSRYMPISSGAPPCNACPLSPECNKISQSKQSVQSFFIPPLYKFADEEDKINSIVHTLTSLNVDYIFTLNLLMFARNMDFSALPDVGILLHDFENPLIQKFFYLRDGDIHSVENMSVKEGLRVYDGERDVTDILRFREIGIRYFTERKSCKELDDYLKSKGYSEYEKRLVYLSFLRPAYQNYNPEYSIPIPDSDDMSSLITHPLFFSASVYDSKPYRDGLVDINTANQSLEPTDKLIEMFKKLCGGETQ